jgi:hypothetical protein
MLVPIMLGIQLYLRNSLGLNALLESPLFFIWDVDALYSRSILEYKLIEAQHLVCIQHDSTML